MEVLQQACVCTFSTTRLGIKASSGESSKARVSGLTLPAIPMIEVECSGNGTWEPLFSSARSLSPPWKACHEIQNEPIMSFLSSAVRPGQKRQNESITSCVSSPVRPRQKRQNAERCCQALSEKQAYGTDRPVLPPHVDTITSPSNSFVKHCVKLRQSSAYRRSVGELLVVGETPLREICDWLVRRHGEGRQRVVEVLLVPVDSDLLPGLQGLVERIVQVSPAVMAKLAGVESPKSVGAVGVLPLPSTFADMADLESGSREAAAQWCPHGSHILALDGIQDPGNLGTLLRTAAAFAWDGVFLLPGCCDPFNEKALRASRGAAYRLPLATGEWRHLVALSERHEMGLYAGDPGVSESSDPSPSTGPSLAMAQFMEHPNGSANTRADGMVESDSGLKRETSGGMEMAAKDEASVSARSIQEALSEERLCLVLGSEGQGLSPAAKAVCKPVAIPMPGGMESLNVAVAGGILLYMLKNGKSFLQ